MADDLAIPYQSLEDKTLPPQHPEGNLEISIRTLASDLELLQKSGGSVSPNARGATMTVGAQGGVRMQAPAQQPMKDRSVMVIWGAVFVVGTIILFLIGYYLVPLVLNGSSDGNTPNNQTNSAADGNTATSQNQKSPGANTSNNSAASGGSVIAHASFLKTKAPIVNLDLYSRSIPPDRSFFLQELTAQAANVQDNFLEVVPRGIGENPLSWADLTALLGVSGLDTAFLSNNFLPDYTMVVARQGGTSSLYPAYIFKLKTGETPLLLQRDALALENNPAAFTSLFLTSPGVPQGNFKDAQISGQPIRSLSFTTAPNKFFYGWFFNTYLIMSTNESGLRATIEHL